MPQIMDETKSEKEKTVDNGLFEEDWSNKALQKKITQLQEQLDLVQKGRKDIQLDIDMLHISWENTKRQLEEKKAEVAEREREMKEVVEKQQNEIRVCKQKVRLMKQEQARIAELKEKGVAVVKHQTDTRLYKQKFDDFYLQFNTAGLQTEQKGETKILEKERPVVKMTCMPMIPHTTSLFKSENPELVSKNTDKRSLKVTPQLPAISDPVPPPPKCKSPSSDAKEQQTKQTLNTILPPGECMKNNQLHTQQVSSMPCTRTEVTDLQKELDFQLQERHARDKGICPIRRELYAHCFDELIRQVTINCAERGLLLSRVKEEILMSIAAYKTQSECGVSFGKEKALQAEQGKSDLANKIAKLENEMRELERQLDEQKAKSKDLETEQDEHQQMVEENHTKEIHFLRVINQQLQNQLHELIATNK